MRKSVVFYLNGKRHELNGKMAMMTVSDFLRYDKGLTGTKVVCAEGDCGACTVLLSRMIGGKLSPYRTLNSCISFVYSLDRCHLISVEGIKSNLGLHPVQESMVQHQGAQCGYCTPGFICSLASMTEDAKKGGFSIDRKRVQNYTTGNLCRCTGYEPIIEAGCKVDLGSVPALSTLYQDQEIERDLNALGQESVQIENDSGVVFLPASIDEALKFRSQYPDARLASGSTDLGVLSNKGKLKLNRILGLHQIAELYEIKEEADALVVGARASLNDLENASKICFPEFSKMLHLFASPQIKNSGTLVGNLMNGSPIADTIPFLRVAEAEIVLMSSSGTRTLNINDFILPGYKQMDVRAGELMVSIRIPKSAHRFKLYKVSTRKDLDISTVTFAARYLMDGFKVSDFSLALGGVGPSVLRMTSIENKIKSNLITQGLFQSIATSLRSEIKPLSDVRGSSEYRHQLCHNLLLKFYDEVAAECGIKNTEVSV
jgi:xanthine dehydrogenase small subunit